MAKPNLPSFGSVPIGEVASPVFVRLADPLQLFARRTERFSVLAMGHELRPYLLFLAELSRLQHQLQDGLPQPDLPDAESLARAREYAMPPLNRTGFVPTELTDETLDRLLSFASTMVMPEAASAALARLQSATSSERHGMIQSVLASSVPIEELAEHGFIAAALQVHFARMAVEIDASSLVPVGDGVCPVCGSPPATTMIVGWQGAHGSRYCACSLCGALWNYVRIKCTLCSSTKGISYQEIEGGPGTIKAEACDSCRCYVKILHQQKDPQLESIADDVASLGLDLLMQEKGYRRGGVNPFLLGY
jgi:FdhE protein